MAFGEFFTPYHFPKLTSLDLSNNNFKEIPPVIFTLTRLTELNLSDNFISEIPQHISQLTSIQILRLKNNRY